MNNLYDNHCNPPIALDLKASWILGNFEHQYGSVVKNGVKYVLFSHPDWEETEQHLVAKAIHDGEIYKVIWTEEAEWCDMNGDNVDWEKFVVTKEIKGRKA